MKTFFYSVIATSFLISYSNAQAQDERIWKASVGLGVAVKKNLRHENRYENMDKKFLFKPIPMVQASVWRFSLGQQGLSFRIFGNQLFESNLFIKRDGDRYQGYGMIPRKESPFAGLSIKYSNFGFNISKDIAGRSKGMMVQLSYGKLFIINEKFVLRTGASLDWADDQYAEYYYGVRAHEATSSRREYHVKNYLQPGVNVLPIYKLSTNTSLMGAAGIKFVPKKVRQSPTMNGDKLEFGGLMGITYSF